MCFGWKGEEALYTYVKRFLDILAALSALVVFSPLLAVTALLVRVTSEGPVIFKQKRIGKDGKVFDIYKFRSMCVGAEQTGTGVYSGKGDMRVTKIGKVLRATSIDELPQLVNILKGEMSFVGERGIIGTTKKKLDFSRVVTVNSISL